MKAATARTTGDWRRIDEYVETQKIREIEEGREKKNTTYDTLTLGTPGFT